MKAPGKNGEYKAFLAAKRIEARFAGIEPKDVPERGKTELTQNLTRACALWMDGKGFKPVETEVGVARGWVADVAGVIIPTQTECINLKLIQRPPRSDWARRDDAAYYGSFRERYIEWRTSYTKIPSILTAHIEVKTSVADFRQDSKWSRPDSPTNLKYVAMPRGMIAQEKWPGGWGVILYGCSQPELNGNASEHLQCARPSPLYSVSVEQSRDVILQIGIRRDNVGRYERLRKLSQRIRISDNKRKSLERITSIISFVLRIAEGHDIEDAKTWSGVRVELPPYILEQLHEFQKKIAP
jgi:hypothetical protein